MSADEEDAPLVRLAPPGERRERSAAAAALLWALEPKRRNVLLAAGGLGLFGLGHWTGTSVERRSSKLAESEAAPALARPVTTLGSPRASQSSMLQPARPAPASPAAAQAGPAHFSGVWVVPDGQAEGAGAALGAGGEAGPPAPGPAEEGRREQADRPPQALVPKTFDQTQRTRGAPAAASGGAATPGDSTRAGNHARPGGNPRAGGEERAHAATPLRAIPGVGTAVEAKRTEDAVGAAGDDARFATQGAGGPRLMTTEGGAAPIGTDAAKAFAIREGGPHQPADGQASGEEAAGEPVKVDLGGKNGGTKP